MKAYIVLAGIAIVTSPLNGQEAVDNDTVEITDWYQAFNGYDVDFAIDTGDDRFISDYASQGGAADTFIDFDLGQDYTLNEIVMTDRVTSGGPNFAWFGGLFDYNNVFSYTLSVDDNFTNGDGITDDILIEVEAEEPEFSPLLEDELELLQTTTSINNVMARYVRWEVVETKGNNPGAANFQFFGGGGLLGDFNNNGTYDAEDIDLLSAEVRDGMDPPEFDLNSDGLVNQDDRSEWVEVLAKTYFGDANIDGEFNSGDLVAVFQDGKFDLDEEATWAQGDWNGDHRFGTGDLVAAFQDGGFEMGPRGAMAAVPEPSTLVLLICGFIVGWRRRA